MSASNKNTKNILKNKNKIFQISADVQSNEMLVFQSRSLIEENRLMILSNYIIFSQNHGHYTFHITINNGYPRN